MFIGKKFGELTVIESAGDRRISNVSKYDTPHYLCKCSCGGQIIVSEPSLEYNIVRDCGCNKYRKKVIK